MWTPHIVRHWLHTTIQDTTAKIGRVNIVATILKNHIPNSVLSRRDWDDPCSTGEPNGWLDAYY